MLFHDYLGTTDLKDKDKSKVAFLSHHVKTMSLVPQLKYLFLLILGLQEEVTLNSSNLRNKHLCFSSLKMENIYNSSLGYIYSYALIYLCNSLFILLQMH